MKEKRQSGIELLRILMTCAVVMLHYNDGKGLEYVTSQTNEVALYVLESICICAVDLYILICGYFSCTNQKRSFLKPFELYFQSLFIHGGIYLAKNILFFCLKNENIFSLSEFLDLFVLSNYFVVLYIVLYFISPYINLVIRELDAKQWKTFLITLLMIFSVYSVYVDIFTEVFDIEKMGMSAITAWGNQRGFNIVNFVLMYIIGAYIRLQNPLNNIKKHKIVNMVFLNTVIITIWAFINNIFSKHGLRSAWVYHNPLVILQAALFFLLFKKFTFRSNVINNLAKASFTCFLLHGTILSYINIQWAVEQSLPVMLLHIACTIIFIYLISWCIYWIYSLVTKKFFYVIGKIKLFRTFDMTDTT